MNIQLSALNFAVGNMHNQQEVSRKANNDQHNFDSVLKNTQINQHNYEVVESKASISRNEKTNRNSFYEAKTTQAQNAKTPSINEEQDFPTEDEIIGALEEKSGISKEQIKSILDELGLTVYDLLLTQNLQQFIHHLHKVEDPMELLSIPNINQTYKDIISLLNELKESFPILQDMANNNELLKSVIVENEGMMQIDLPEDNLIQEHQTQNMASIGNNVALEKKSQLEDDFSQKNSDTQSQNKNAPLVEIEKEENISSEGLLREDELQESNDMGVNHSEFIEFAEVNDNQVIIQHNTITDNHIIESAQTQINSRPVNTEQLIKQMVEYIKVNIKEDSTEMNLQLKPDHLGNLSLKIVTERGIITAQFVAESQAVKEIIEANFNQLKDVLQEQGLLIENLEVSVKQDFQEQQSSFMERNTSKSSKRIKEILTNLTEDSPENYNVEYNNPYIRSESEIDFSA